MKKEFLLILMILVGSVAAKKATTRMIRANQKRSVVTYYMSHPFHHWKGVNKKVNSLIVYNKQKKEIQKVAVSLSVSKFDSGNGSRDSHMMEVLDALDYPRVTFSSNSIKQNGNHLLISGTLNFHNVKHQIKFKATQQITHKYIKVTGGFNIDMTDYDVKPPTLLGIATSKMIKLKFKMLYDLN